MKILQLIKLIIKHNINYLNKLLIRPDERCEKKNLNLFIFFESFALARKIYFLKHNKEFKRVSDENINFVHLVK